MAATMSPITLSFKPRTQAVALANAKINAFQSSSSTTTPAFPNFTKGQIATSLVRRINAPETINQIPASLCGPASFYFTLATYHPDAFVESALQLYESGETRIGSLHIKPGNDAKNMTTARLVGPYGNVMDEVDWLMLASLRDSENTLYDYDSVTDEFSGITMPDGLLSWYQRVGAKKVVNSTNVVFAKGIESLFEAQKQKDAGSIVCVFISMNILTNNTAKPVFFPDHWVVLTSDILVDGKKINLNLTNQLVEERRDYYDEHTDVNSFKHNIAFDLYSWGQSPSTAHGGISKSNSVDLEDFLRHFYGFVAANLQ